jgi:CheY-like chemotaxis protein
MSASAHVMLVDDQEHMRGLLRMLFDVEMHSAPLRFTEASTGQEAIMVCQREHVDLMVLDLHMPGVSGLEVLRVVKALQDPPRVVAWSADDNALRQAVAIGVNASVDKTDMNGLADALHACLANGSS